MMLFTAGAAPDVYKRQIMFLAALEMDMEGMKKNKSRLIIYGLLTCFVPFFLQ